LNAVEKFGKNDQQGGVIPVRNVGKEKINDNYYNPNKNYYDDNVGYNKPTNDGYDHNNRYGNEHDYEKKNTYNQPKHNYITNDEYRTEVPHMHGSNRDANIPYKQDYNNKIIPAKNDYYGVNNTSSNKNDYYGNTNINSKQDYYGNTTSLFKQEYYEANQSIPHKQDYYGTTSIVPPKQDYYGTTSTVPPKQDYYGTSSTVPPRQDYYGTTTTVQPKQDNYGTTSTVPPRQDYYGTTSNVPPKQEYYANSPHTEGLWSKSLNYNKNALFFMNDGQQVFYYNFNNGSWKQLNINSNYYFGSGIRGCELPDSSYFLTGGDFNKRPGRNSTHFLNGVFKDKNNMLIGRKCHSTVHLKGNVYVFGGIGEYGAPIADCERFSLIQEIWTSMEKMKLPKAYSTPVVYGTDQIYLIGGYSSQPYDHVI
jgi:hypothetical protein